MRISNEKREHLKRGVQRELVPPVMLLAVVFCFSAGVRLDAQQTITVLLDGWNSGTCDRIPSDEFESRGVCDGTTPFTWTRDYQQFSLSTTPQTTSVTFLDPGDPDWKITHVRARVYLSADWLRQPLGCPMFQAPLANLGLSASINNQVINTLNPYQIVAQDSCVTYPGCNGPNSYICTTFLQAWFDQIPPGDFPGYAHGGTNTFTFTFQTNQPRGDIPSISLEKVALELTFTCAVCVDVDNNFSASAPVDDNKQFVPGTTLNGTELPLPATGQPIQQIKVHVLTPGVRGNKKVNFTLSGVSNYPGMAMNYPISNPVTTSDMLFTNGTLSLLNVSVPNSNDTVANINIYDYAASGTLTVVAPTASGTTVTYTKKIPQDNDGNGLPDAGWPLPGGIRVVTTGLSTAADTDQSIGTTAGDGLTALEEYRGFFVAIQHIRTDPRRQDLFLDVDPQILVLEPGLSGIGLVTNLPLSLHYVDPGESSSQDFNGTGNNDVPRIKPVINPNRGSMPGSNEQRAVRVRYQVDPPLYNSSVYNTAAPAYFFAYGRAFHDGENLDVTGDNVPGTPAPPNQMQVVEYYPLAFENNGISWGANGILESLNDGAGNPVPDCAVNPGASCDTIDSNLQAVVPAHYYLNTVLNASSDDFYTTTAYQDCARLLSKVAETPSQFSRLKVNIVGHEIAHAISVHHTADCGDVMYDATDAAGRHLMAEYLPYATTYSLQNLLEIALH